MNKTKLLLVLLISILNIGINNGQSRTETDSIGIVLRALYDNLDGDNWKHKDNWFSDKPYEEWYGLKFDVSGLYGINLMDNNLTGVLPPEIGMLPHSCLSLDVRRNNISGNLPVEILKVPHLYPYIKGNKFTGTLLEAFKSAFFYDEEWLKTEVCQQKAGYGFDFPATVNMIKIDDNIYLHPHFNAIEYRLENIKIEDLLMTDYKTDITRKLYKLFDDKFDIIVYLFNGISPFSSGSGFADIKNNIEGIGKKNFDNSSHYGSNGRLTGIIHTYRDHNALNHEMMHNWSGLDLEQLVYSSDKLKKDPNHWGVSDVNGILGGFPIDKIKNNIDGNPNKYQIRSYTNTSYAPLELYLMGLIDIKEVPDIHVYTDIPFYERDPENITFIANTLTTWTWQDIERKFGKRNPSVENSQKEFSILTVILTTDPVNNLEWEVIQERINSQADKEDTNDPYIIKSFWQATGGRASIEIDKLNEKLKNPIVSNDKIDVLSSLRLIKNQDAITISSQKLVEKIDIYDMNGRFIKNESVNSNNHTIHLRPNIHYIIKAYFKDKSTESIKI